MRQQGANLFDGGMNLDKNPLNISNHELTSALNATVVTMNGNEGVLQNDMGNARVDQAQLPVGYVPVGMKEHGGIIYVASYNPLKGESLIGCFPSPERNLSSEDEGLSADDLKRLCDFMDKSYSKITQGNPENDVIYYSDDNGKNEIDPDSPEYYQKDLNTGTYVQVAYSSLDLSKPVYTDPQGDVEITFYKLDDILSINDTDNEIILINDVLRAGDKFIIVSDDFDNWDLAIGCNYLKFKIMVKDAEGNGIDITNQLKDYNDHTYINFKKIRKSAELGETYDDNDFNIYKNKISGRLYLKEELIIPAYINVKILGETIANQPNKRKVTFKIKAYDEDGNYWGINNIYDYILEVKDSHENIINYTSHDTLEEFIFDEVDDSETLTYTVYPCYNYDCMEDSCGTIGKIEKLKRSGSIEVGSIASGEVKFKDLIFCYFNDHAKGKLILEYSLEAYVDDSGWSLKRIYLETYDIEDLFDNNGDFLGASIIGNNAYKKEIDLGISNYFGLFSKGLYYDTSGSSNSDFLEGHYYVTRIVAEVEQQDVPHTIRSYESDWYAVITSIITNDDYFNRVRQMYPISYSPNLPSTLKPKTFYLDWNTEFTREDNGSTVPITSVLKNNKRLNSNVLAYYQNDQFINSDIESNFKTTPPSLNTDNTIAYLVFKSGQISYKYHGTTTVNTHVSFPYECVFNPQVYVGRDNDERRYSANVNYVGNSTDNTKVWYRNLIRGCNNQVIQEKPNVGNWKYSSSELLTVYERNGNDGITYHYNLPFQFFSDLQINLETQDWTESRRFNKQITTDLFIPYTPFYIVDDNLDKTNLEYVFGPIHYKANQTDYHIRELLPKQWFAYERYALDHDDNNSWNDASNRYDLNACMLSGITPVEVNTSDESSNRRLVKYRSQAEKLPVESWANISNGIYNCYDDPPAIIFWYGSLLNPTAITKVGDGTWVTSGSYPFIFYNYVLMLILGNDGEYYIANQWGCKPSLYDMMYYICKAFNQIYVCQPNQNINLDYWRNSLNIEDYVYTKPYSVEYSTKVWTAYNAIGTNPLPMDLKINSSISHYNEHNKNRLEKYVVYGLSWWYLPKFSIDGEQTDSSSKKCEKIFTDSIQSPDETIKIEGEFLDSTSTPTSTSTLARVQDENGYLFIKEAYIYDSDDKLHETNFIPDRCYMLCGYTNKKDGDLAAYGDIIDSPTQNTPSSKALLIDINNSDLNKLFKTHVINPRSVLSCNPLLGVSPIRLGYYPAFYIKNKTLVVQFNNDNNYKLLKVNSGKSNLVIDHAPRGTYNSGGWSGDWAGYYLGDLCNYTNSDHNFARETLYQLTKAHVINFEPLYRSMEVDLVTYHSICPSQSQDYPAYWYSDLYHPEYLYDPDDPTYSSPNDPNDSDLKNWSSTATRHFAPVFLDYQMLFNKPRYDTSIVSTTVSI